MKAGSSVGDYVVNAVHAILSHVSVPTVHIQHANPSHCLKRHWRLARPSPAIEVQMSPKAIPGPVL